MFVAICPTQWASNKMGNDHNAPKTRLADLVSDPDIKQKVFLALPNVLGPKFS